jgi:hypothetical protein
MTFENPIEDGSVFQPGTALEDFQQELSGYRMRPFYVGQGETVLFDPQSGSTSKSGKPGDSTTGRGTSSEGFPFQSHSTGALDEGHVYHIPRWSTDASGMTAVNPAQKTVTMFMFSHDEIDNDWTTDYTSMRMMIGLEEVSSAGAAPLEIKKTLSGILSDGRDCALAFFDTDTSDTAMSLATSDGSSSNKENVQLSGVDFMPQSDVIYAGYIDTRVNGQITLWVFNVDTGALAGKAVSTTALPANAMALCISTVAEAASNNVRQVSYGAEYYYGQPTS